MPTTAATSTTGDEHYLTTWQSPVGELTLIATDNGLRAVAWEGTSSDAAELPPLESITRSTSHPVLAKTVNQLKEYFGSQRGDFDLPLDLRGTEFQQLAWRALATIPAGKTASYGEQARRIGRPKAVRAVGSANGRNPMPIVLPCHRVVASGGGLGGYSGAGGLDTKQFLLNLEQSLVLVLENSRQQATCCGDSVCDSC